MEIYSIPKLNTGEIATSAWKLPTILHKHTDFEFTAIASGSGQNIINGKPYETDFGTFLLLGPQHVHQQLASSPMVRRDICVSTDLMKEICDELTGDLYKIVSATLKPVKIRLLPSVCENIFSRLEVLENPIITDENTRKAVLRSIVLFLLGVYLQQQFENSPPAPLADFLKKIYNPDVFSRPVSDIIPLTNYSHSRFLVLFKQYTGKKLIDYITDLRMDYAAKLLIQTDMSIISIAGAAGYDNQSFFTKKFKEKYNVTPKDFRKNRLLS